MGKPQLMDEECWELIEEYQFDSTIKRMSTVWYNRPVNRNMIFSKGAAERILPLCNNLTTKESQDNVMNQVHQLASKGLRVLALAYRDAQGIDVNNIAKQENGRELIECDLTFLGLTGGELHYNSCILLTI
jgi:magnesium-transporting ATPase (P-type)